MKYEKIADILFFGFVFSYMALCVFTLVYERKNPDRFNTSMNQIFIQEEETSMFVNLYVVDKQINPSGMIGIPNQYELILSSEIFPPGKSASPPDFLTVPSEIFPPGKSAASDGSVPDFLAVQNKLSVSVTREEFKKYEINECYEFELVEKTTILKSLRVVE